MDIPIYMDRVSDLRSPRTPRKYRHGKNDAATIQNARSVDHKQKQCRLRVNIGGIYFEILEGNLSQFPDTLLGGDRKKFFYDEERHEYFFDRDPVTFKYVLDFYRTGKFHISTPDCMESIRDELAFFGIPEAFVSECCCEHIAFEKENDVESIHQVLTQDIAGRKKLYKFLTEFDSSVWAAFFSYFFVVVVIINICLIVSETLECDNFTKCVEYYKTFFFVVDSFCVAVFTFEFFARLFSCPNRIEFMKDYSNAVDLVGILPYYIGIVERMANTNNVLLRSIITTLRIFRIFRVMKLARHSEQFQNLLHSIAQAGAELGGILFSFLALMIVFSTIIFFVEDGGATNQDGFTSIPSAFWYTLVTMTTLGYGDMYPTTLIGKLIGSACALAGVVLLALPVPIIEEKLNENNRKLNRRKEAKIITVTQSMTKRIAVSLASLKSLSKRLWRTNSQTSMDMEVSCDEATTEMKRSTDDLSIYQSSSGGETIKASSSDMNSLHLVNSSPAHATNYHLPRYSQKCMGSYDSIKSGCLNETSSNYSRPSCLGEQVTLERMNNANAYAISNSCALLNQRSDSQHLVPIQEIGTNTDTADFESGQSKENDDIFYERISSI